MITWMQKHKKWLVITIWISTIAFVGAGFVGWGSYDYNKSGSGVATVGSKEIKMTDLQDEYSRLYGQYQGTLGKAFNKEMAEQLKLEDQAYNNLIQKYLLLNLASDLGIDATKDETVAELLNIPTFLKDGKFDKQTYLKVLQQNRTNPSEFEEKIRINKTVNKLQNIFKTTSNENALNSINQLFYASDEISINIINTNELDAAYTQDEVKSHWEQNKNNFMSTKKYKVNIEKIALGEDRKASKKEALKKYLSIKKGESKFTNSELLDESAFTIDALDLKSIFTSKINTVLKPIKTNTHYIITQLVEIIEPKPLAFEEVLTQVENQLALKKTNEALELAKNNLISNFTGTNIGFINKEDAKEIAGLSQQESQSLVQAVFNSTTLVSFVQLENKIVVFKILDTKLATLDKTKNDLISQSIDRIKDNEVIDTVIKSLTNKYEVQSNIRAN